MLALPFRSRSHHPRFHRWGFGHESRPWPFFRLGLALGLFWVGSAQAAEQPPPDEQTLETVEVRGRAADLLGKVDSASQGEVGRPQFEHRPLERVGELVEVVPGTIATQHSGSGKANQYFLRGFNLDHGTDFNATLDGVPMNLRTNAHGQGYLDLNSIIPELVDRVEYGKGPYYAEQGDFSSAGYARFFTLASLPKGFVSFTGGQYSFYRGVAADSSHLGPGDLLYAGEVQTFQGPWVQPENLGKYNGMLRYTVSGEDYGLALNGKAYSSSWIATNQIPQQAIWSKELSLYGTMDPTDGGSSNRYSLVANGFSKGKDSKNQFNLYALYYDLNLYSNFTGYLENPVLGDQIHQQERRVTLGGNGEQTWFHRWLDFEMDETLGVQVQYDGIRNLGLSRTYERQFLSSVSLDNVDETNLSFYARNQTQWLSKFRTVLGLRSDTFFFDVQSKLTPQNSGNRTATLISPKLTLIAGPWFDTEYFINMGYGFHSNDARGVTARVDPLNPAIPLQPVPGLARQQGVEGGVRSQYLPGLVTTLALWYLHSDSELVFVGDAGTTEPTEPSNRYGVEWTNYYQPFPWLTLDADFAFTHARFTQAPEGFPANATYIPNSVARVIGAGALVQLPNDFYATVRVREFGNVPLNEQGTANMGNTTLVNLGGGYQYKSFKVQVDLFNLFDAKTPDIAYYYEYRFPQNMPATEGVLLHPVMPRQVRFTATLSF